MKNLLIGLTLTVFFGCYNLIAQENISGSDSLNVHQNIENINSNLNLNNAAMIQQVGNYNEANINQAGNSGIFPNMAEINQQGVGNIASSSQNGNSNLTLIGQNGSNNSADINVVGNFNLAGVLQVGNGNAVQQDLIGDGISYGIIQFGNNNLVNQLQTQPTSIPIQIHQNGNGMRLTIINGGIH